jgi:hypothetical protein
VHDAASHAADAFRGLAVRQGAAVSEGRRMQPPPMPSVAAGSAWMS